jgi:hypothetical protein
VEGLGAEQEQEPLAALEELVLELVASHPLVSVPALLNWVLAEARGGTVATPGTTERRQTLSLAMTHAWLAWLAMTHAWLAWLAMTHAWLAWLAIAAVSLCRTTNTQAGISTNEK